jgi:hypothetical protein
MNIWRRSAAALAILLLVPAASSAELLRVEIKTLGMD